MSLPACHPQLSLTAWLCSPSAFVFKGSVNSQLELHRHSLAELFLRRGDPLGRATVVQMLQANHDPDSVDTRGRYVSRQASGLDSGTRVELGMLCDRCGGRLQPDSRRCFRCARAGASALCVICGLKVEGEIILWSSHEYADSGPRHVAQLRYLSARRSSVLHRILVRSGRHLPCGMRLQVCPVVPLPSPLVLTRPYSQLPGRRRSGWPIQHRRLRRQNAGVQNRARQRVSTVALDRSHEQATEWRRPPPIEASSKRVRCLNLALHRESRSTQVRLFNRAALPRRVPA